MCSGICQAMPERMGEMLLCQEPVDDLSLLSSFISRSQVFLLEKDVFDDKDKEYEKIAGIKEVAL